MPRAALAFAAWNDQKDTYRDSYVNPRQWQIRLNGCDSVVDGQTIGPLSTKPSPSWTLEPLDGQAVDGQPLPAVSVPSEPGPGTCARTIFLRALGRWRITMTVTDAAGVPASVATERTFRDVLIAAVGDSFTSGEGGKTRNGSWADEQCDRGMNAWPALLARERVENGSITVTYLNFACSGAEVKQLTTEFYNGINPPRHLFPLKPQLQALRNAIGDPLNPATRTVDLLVANVGINEMGGSGVADLLYACAVSLRSLITHFPIDCRQDLSSDIARLPDLYDTVEVAASSRLRLGAVHLVGYPARIFTNSSNKFAGCGAFRSMDSSSLLWVHDTVNNINREMALASLRNGWSFTDVTDTFRRHGYCSSRPWFMSAAGSKWRQGNFNGSAHPNKSGHRATAAQVRKTVRLDAPPPPPAHLNVHFLRVRVSHEGTLRWTGELSIGVADYPAACADNFRPLILTLNKWKDVSADPCSRYDIRTVGRTIAVSGLAYLFKPSNPHDPRIPPGGMPARISRADPDFYFPVRRLHRRRDGWNSTAPSGLGCTVQHVVGKRKPPTHGDNHTVTMEFDYEISTADGLAVDPCNPGTVSP